MKLTKNILFALPLLLAGVCWGSDTADVWDGQGYIENSAIQQKWGKKYTNRLELNGDESILDLGCGDGRVTKFIASKVPNGSVVGVDISDSMLEAAERMMDEDPVPNLHFEKHSAAALPFDNQFDWVVSYSCFHWIDDHNGAIHGISRALKPSGKVFLYFAPDHGKNRFDHCMDKVMAREEWAHYFEGFESGFHLITLANLASLLEKNDLFLERMEVITVDEAFKSRTAFRDWIAVWMTHLQRLPKEKRTPFIDAIIDEYLALHPVGSDGVVHFYDYWLELVAHKA